MGKRVALHGVLAVISLTGALVAAGCADDVPRIAAPSPEGPAVAFKAKDIDGLASSAVCTVAGGDPVHLLVLNSGFDQAIVASEPSYLDNPDMNTVNETGPHAGRYLYHAHENGTNAGVSVTDLLTGQTKVIAQRADWERFDGMVWTPWGTLLSAEEASPASARDPRFPSSVGGLVYEFFLNASDPTVVDRVLARPAIGAKSHEGMRFDNNGNLYSISERNPGYVFKFVPDTKGDLSSGQTYVLKVTQPTGDRVGGAVWIALDRMAVQVNADAAADAVGATGYDRPEDVEIATSTGNNSGGGASILYVAITGPGDNRVIGIDLRGEGDSNGVDAVVFNYVARGVNADAQFEMPDNLTLDKQGNLFITEDPGGNFQNGLGKTKGDDIWMAAPSEGLRQPAARVARFASINDCDAEPTGVYFDKGSDRLFVNIQHRGGDRQDKTVAIFKE